MPLITSENTNLINYKYVSNSLKTPPFMETTGSLVHYEFSALYYAFIYDSF
jgi:hypothetical protein